MPLLLVDLGREIVKDAIHGPGEDWIAGFAKTKGVAPVLQVEVRALYEWLTLAWDKGFPQVEAESDNALLIESIRNGCAADNNFVKLRLIHQLSSMRLRHVRR